MPLTTDIANLSQTPALNNPDGATDPPSLMDDQLRYHASFIAKLRDGVGFALNAIISALGYTPVQQGTGTGQASNAVKIGWNGSTALRVQVDNTDYGSVWPHSISGNAATATSATTAGNATQFAGLSVAEFVKRASVNTIAISWDGAKLVGAVDGTGGLPFYTNWGSIPDRPTALSQFTNNLGTINSASIGGSTIQGVLSATGQTVNWTGFLVSDERVKKNVRATAQDSLSKIARLDFKQFDFDLEKVPFQTEEHQRLGIIAQQAAAIDPSWAGPVQGSDYMHLRDQPMLMACLHAIKQLSARVAELEGRA